MEANLTSVFAGAAMLESGWEANVRITTKDGKIETMRVGTTPESSDETCSVLLPGVGNLHSHAFQRAMSGLAEVRGPANDSFWSWRTVMYKFALAFSPEQLEAVAAQLYMEMLEAGYTRVGEFHYLHHDRDGRQYSNIAEHAERIAAATSSTGISLTLLPVFYAHSGFGGAEPSHGQRRFINTAEQYAKLLDASRAVVSRLPGGKIGIAPHSLRAATPPELQEVLTLAHGGPIHIHISEQVKEVEDCVAWSGARPVEWLLANAAVNEDWTLVHATHMTEAETIGVAERGATAGLCPITEANLGDGTFPAPTFLDHGGLLGVGSDSNVSISLARELRQLEYSQRLHLRSRNVIAHSEKSTGERLFSEVAKGGGRSLKAGGRLAVGQEADFVALDTSGVSYLARESLLDHWVFGDGVRVDKVWVRGQKRVENGRHVDRERISTRFAATMNELLQQF